MILALDMFVLSSRESCQLGIWIDEPGAQRNDLLHFPKKKMRAVSIYLVNPFSSFISVIHYFTYVKGPSRFSTFVIASG